MRADVAMHVYGKGGFDTLLLVLLHVLLVDKRVGLLSSLSREKHDPYGMMQCSSTQIMHLPDECASSAKARNLQMCLCRVVLSLLFGRY